MHHPFQTTLGYGDQRVTYKVDEEFFNTYLFAVMHESGHAMYEQGVVKETIPHTFIRRHLAGHPRVPIPPVGEPGGTLTRFLAVVLPHPAGNTSPAS